MFNNCLVRFKRFKPPGLRFDLRRAHGLLGFFAFGLGLPHRCEDPNRHRLSGRWAGHEFRFTGVGGEGLEEVLLLLLLLVLRKMEMGKWAINTGIGCIHVFFLFFCKGDPSKLTWLAGKLPDFHRRYIFKVLCIHCHFCFPVSPTGFDGFCQEECKTRSKKGATIMFWSVSPLYFLAGDPQKSNTPAG